MVSYLLEANTKKLWIALLRRLCCWFIFVNFIIGSVFAEGSRDLIKNGGNRAYVASTLNPGNTSAATAASYPFPTLGTVKVFVRAGETLYLGSSAQGMRNGTIIARAPNGAVYTSGSGLDGRINDLEEEQNGPDVSPFTDGTKYKPYVVPVLAGQDGVWEIDFVSPDPDNIEPGSVIPPMAAATENWSGQSDNSIYITAFDVSVRNAANTAFINGRAFTNIYNGYLASFKATFNSKFNVVTKDGYIYEVNNNGHAGNGFAFFVNNKGFRDANGNATYQSYNTSINPPVHDPRAADTGTDITHKIFFNTPGTDLPTSANTPGGGTTWVLNTPASPSATDLLFTGLEGTLYSGGTSPLGGNLTFTSNQAIAYTINLDINKNGVFTDAVDVTFTGTASVGNNTIYWNGLNGEGNPIARTPGQPIAFDPANVKVTLRGGEVHFPFVDVENNVNGIIITRKNGANPETDEVYWNDNNITHSTPQTGSNPMVSTGISSTLNGHKFGIVATNESGEGFGNEKGLDTWTYVLSSPANPLMNIQLKEADLEVVGISSDPGRTTFCAGEEITYTVTLKNNGPNDVTGAKFAFNYPTGFEFVSFTSATSGVSALYNNASNATAFSATVDMENQAVLTLTIKGKTSTTGALSTISASILRPADVTDPDATNPDTAVPTDAAVECTFAPDGSCNNMKTAASVTIVSRDISIQGAAVVEGTGTVNKISFQVSIPTSTSCPVTVAYTVSHNTSSASDFDSTVPFTGTVTIPAGSTAVSLDLLLNTDRIIETNETFTVTLSNPVGGILNIATATGTIQNDDEVQITVEKADGAEAGAVPGSFIFRLNSGVTSDVSTEIDYALAGTSKAGTDYTHAAISTGTIIIPAGQNSVTLNLPVIDDQIVEGDETVTIALTRLYNAHDGTPTNNSPVTPIVNIVDNDYGTLTLSNDVVLDETNAGTVTATFTLTLDKATGSFFTLNYATADGTAKSSDNDYVASGSVQLNFSGAAGESKEITITVNGDTKIEASELLTLALSNLSNSFQNRLKIPVASRTLTIKNDDAGLINIGKTSGEEGVQSGSFVFGFLPGLSTDVPITINYTLSGTAKAGTDYTHAVSSTGTVVIPAGANSVTLNLPVYDDLIVEGTETVQINAAADANPYGIVVANSPQVIDILDNDNAVLTITPEAITEGDAGTSKARFKVKLSNATGAGFTIGYSTTTGTATTADLDYAAPASGSLLSFNGTNPGEEQTIEITINGDRNIEADEVFNVLLASPSNTFDNRLTLQSSAVAATIPNDDSGIISVTKTDGAETNAVAGAFIFAFPAGYTSDKPTTINYTLAGTANASGGNIDYTPSAVNSIVIPAGANSVTLNLAINDDSIVEDDETIALGGVSVSSVYPEISLNPTIPVVTITDNDQAKLLLTGPVQLSEGNNGVTLAAFTVTLDKATKAGFSLDYAVTEGTALLADNDFVSNSASLSFTGEAGEAKTIAISINGDLKIEHDETFVLKLLTLATTFNGRLTVPVTSSTFTIKNDDSPAITISGADGTEGSFNGGFTFKFPAGVVSTTATDINYSLGGTAIGGGTDYTETINGMVTIPAGQNSVTLPVSVVNDQTVESTETVQITASVAANSFGIVVANSPQTINVIDNDEATLSISGPVSITEGHAGTLTATFNVALSHATESSFTVNYNTADGTAIANTDYISNAGVLNFDGLTAGQVRSISVTINGDTNVEADETFNVNLNSLSANFSNRLKLATPAATSTILNDDGGDIKITATDGAEAGQIAGKFTFSFDPGVTSDQPTIINYTLGGTAFNGTDYTDASSGSITIPAGTNSVTLSLPVFDDAIVEDNETVTITTGAIINPHGLSVSNTFVTLTIADNDIATLTLAGPLPLHEKHAGTTDAVFTVTLDKATQTGFTLNYTTADGTAQVIDQDYIPLSGPLSFTGTAGESKTIAVKINGDKKIEADETFILNLGALSTSFNTRLTVTVSSSTGTIKNDDSGAITITKADGEEGVQAGRFTFSLPSDVSSDVPTVISYNLSGTALGDGKDYTAAATGAITIAPGENSVTLTLPVIDDLILENTETVVLTTSAVASPYSLGIANSPQTINILDNDKASLSISPLTITEGNEGTSTATFSVTLDKETTSPFTVNFQTADGTATAADADYVANTGTLNFTGAAGQQTISITINGDRKIENDETFSIKLSGLSNTFNGDLTLAADEAIGTVSNDDTGIINITPADGSEAGPAAASFVFAFQAGYTADQPTKINYTLNGTALANGVDYVGPTSGFVTIPAGQNSISLSFPVIDDAIVEEAETITLASGTIESMYSFSVPNPQQSLTVADNDRASLLLSSDVVVDEGNTGAVTATFTVTLNNAVAFPFSLNHATSDGTALIADNDYISASGNLNFAGTSGETKTISVKINGDNKIEANEQLNLTLSNLSNDFSGRLTINTLSRRATIKNDDVGIVTITKTDGQEGLQGGSFIFSLPQGLSADIPVLINYSLGGTANSGGVDYIGATPSTITLPAGANTVTLTLHVVDDSIIEDTEVVELQASVASNSYGISLSNSSESHNILDNDNATVSVGPASITEGAAGTQQLKFPVTLDKATGTGFTLSYSTSDGTATVADGDYASAATTSILSFGGAAGEVQYISIAVNGDKKIEADERFNVKLDNLSKSFSNRLKLQTAIAEGTIINDDSGIITITKTDGSETGPAAASFMFTLADGHTSDVPVTISYTLSGTAGGNGLDYTGIGSASVVIPAGQSFAKLSLPVIDDIIVEDAESVTLAVTSINSVYGSVVSLNSAIPELTIADNDFAIVSLSRPVVMTEGHSGTTAFSFSATLDKATSNPFTVNYFTTDGTATTADNDYIPSGTVALSFAGTAGESKTISVLVKGDRKMEDDEAFSLALGALSGTFGNRLKIQGSPVSGTIKNDDSAVITVFKIDGTEGLEDGRFIFSFPEGVSSDAATTINYRLDGTATSADYNAAPISSVVIPAGATSATLVLPVIDDSVLEEPESVRIDIVSTNNSYNKVEWALPLPVATIFDNDNASIILSGPAAVEEGNNGTRTVTFTATLDKLTSKGFDVDYTTVDGTATVADKDYEFKSGRLTFAGFAGETKEITVVITGDVKVEDPENFGLMLDGVNPAFAGRLSVKGSPASATILNDDDAPVAVADLATTVEDTPVTFSIVANDTDADGVDPKTVTLTSLPAKGVLTANHDGTVTYTPALNDFGTYRFTYSIKDIFGLASNETKGTITVTPINDAPIAENDNFYVFKNVSYRGTVASNDTDPDLDVLTFRLLSSPAKGKLEFFNVTDGSFIYTPETGFEGKDTFVYEIRDPSGLTDKATATLNVQPKTVVSLTPLRGAITEGDTISVTAELTEAILQDVTVNLDYNGQVEDPMSSTLAAENFKDFSLTGNHQSITIPAGTKRATQKLVINSIRDLIKEKDEHINVTISLVTPSAFVSIGSSSLITIKDFYPESGPVDPNANGDINPDPLTSPNGDGIGNERFVIHNIASYPDNEVVIFNRWGNEVYRIKGYNNGDKSFTGVANRGILSNDSATLVDGVYYFIIYTKTSGGTQKMNKGFVIVKR